MKKILALILALTLALGTVACGNSAPANGGAAGASGDPAVPAAEGMQETPDMVLRLSEDQSPDFPTTQAARNLQTWFMSAPTAGLKSKCMIPALWAEPLLLQNSFSTVPLICSGAVRLPWLSSAPL